MSRIKEILEQFYRDYETDIASVVPPIGMITNLKEQQRQGEHFWNLRIKEAEQAILAEIERVIGQPVEHLGDKWCPTVCECGAERTNENIQEQRKRVGL